MRLLLISSSVVHGYGFLDHAEPEIRRHLHGVRRVGFVPWAAGDHAAYTQTVRERFAAMELDVLEVEGPREIEEADAVFVGGGNTFRLLSRMYERGVLEPIRSRVRGGMPYMGSSAGTNVAAPTIRTTNDMPIVQPPSFEALGLVTYQINPHYLDADAASTHQGETRETRLREYLEENSTPVVGLREGSMLLVTDGTTTLLGEKTARIFTRGAEPFEVSPGVVQLP